jgi:hypothetical protein
VVAANVKLPDFWADTPDTWFIRAESILRTRKITGEKAKFDHVVGTLPSAVIRQVHDILTDPPAANPFTALKEALLKRLIQSEAERTRLALDEEVLGDRTPSQLLRHLESLLPAADSKSAMFRYHYINKMPASIRPFLVSNSAASLADLATQADNLLTFHRAQPTTVAAASSTSDSALAEVLARIRNLEKGTKSKSANTGGLCFYHRKFGDKARKCQLPCSKNGQAGSWQ